MYCTYLHFIEALAPITAKVFTSLQQQALQCICGIAYLAWEARLFVPGLGLTIGTGACPNLGLLKPGGRALGWIGTGS